MHWQHEKAFKGDWAWVSSPLPAMDIILALTVVVSSAADTDEVWVRLKLFFLLLEHLEPFLPSDDWGVSITWQLANMNSLLLPPGCEPVS